MIDIILIKVRKCPKCGWCCFSATMGLFSVVCSFSCSHTLTLFKDYLFKSFIVQACFQHNIMVSFKVAKSGQEQPEPTKVYMLCSTESVACLICLINTFKMVCLLVKNCNLN